VNPLDHANNAPTTKRLVENRRIAYLLLERKIVSLQKTADVVRPSGIFLASSAKDGKIGIFGIPAKLNAFTPH
jgi:hypothetical protein